MTKRKRNVSVSFRTTKEESEKIHELADFAGVTLSEYLSAAALGKEIIRFDDLNEFTKELKAQGNNLNQLTYLAHSGKIKCVNIDALLELYGQIFRRIKELLERRKNVGDNNGN